MKPAASTLKTFYMKLKHHVAIMNEGSLVHFKLHTGDAVNWWNDNVEPGLGYTESGTNIKYVEHRYAQDIYEGMLKHFGK